MFILLNVYFLVGNYFISEIFCGYVNSTTFGNHKAGRIGRFFGLFNIVSFRDDECNSTTQGVRGIISNIKILILEIYFPVLTM